MIFRKYFYLVIFLFAFISVIQLLIGCSCKCEQQEESDIPEAIIKKSNEFIAAQTGKDFFNKFIKIDLQKSKKIAPNYFMVYRFIMPDKDFINEPVQFIVDSMGNVLKDMDISGIPKCMEGECDFSVNETDAIKIAKENGLEAGISDWKRDFIWNEKYNKYVWIVLSTLSEIKSEVDYKGSGQEVIIDPNSGKLLTINEWHIR